MIKRNVIKLIHGDDVIDGAGVRVKRVFSKKNIDDLDPFLQLDIINSSRPEDYLQGFPETAHKGIEIIYYLANGDLEHTDNLGNNVRMRSGDCQWITAANGLMHKEMPKPSAQMLGFILWLNMPRNDKNSDPQYQCVRSAQIPAIYSEGVEIRLIAGSYNGKEAPFPGEFVKPNIFDISLKPGAVFEWNCPIEETMLLCFIEGNGSVGELEEIYEEQSAMLLDHHSKLFVRAGAPGLRLFLFSAASLLEPVVWDGSIVMSTQKDVEAAKLEPLYAGRRRSKRYTKY